MPAPGQPLSQHGPSPSLISSPERKELVESSCELGCTVQLLKIDRPHLQLSGVTVKTLLGGVSWGKRPGVGGMQRFRGLCCPHPNSWSPQRRWPWRMTAGGEGAPQVSVPRGWPTFPGGRWGFLPSDGLQGLTCPGPQFPHLQNKRLVGPCRI